MVFTLTPNNLQIDFNIVYPQVGVVMYLLYLKLGISAIYGSIICIFVMTPLQFLIGKAMSTNLKNASVSQQNL